MKRTFGMFGFVVGSLFWATGAFAVITCPGTLNGTFDINDDVSQTSAGTCITIGSSNVTVNLHGHTIYCNYAAGRAIWGSGWDHRLGPRSESYAIIFMRPTLPMA